MKCGISSLGLYTVSLITPDLVANDRCKPVHYRDPLLPMEKRGGARCFQEVENGVRNFQAILLTYRSDRRPGDVFGIRGQNSPFVLAAVYVTYSFFWTCFVRPREHTLHSILHPDSGCRQLSLYVNHPNLSQRSPLSISTTLGQVSTVLPPPRKILFEIQEPS